MKTVILLFQCADQKGIVAKISDFIFKNGGNIVTADQFSTDPEGGHFFLRIEFYIDEREHTVAALEAGLKPIAGGFKADARLFVKDTPLRMGILVSKADHCLVDLLYLWRSGEIKVDIPFVISNHSDNKALAEQYGIPFHLIKATAGDKKERDILALAKEKSDFLVLARYMQILSGSFIVEYGKPLINIHHSFLPSFKGADPYQQAFDRGVKVIGATAHFVTESLDDGPIITQMVESVSHKDTVNDLVRKGKNLEKHALAQAVRHYIDYRIFKYQNKTIVF
jgi:formyltetrahydrofolate deformylase